MRNRTVWTTVALSLTMLAPCGCGESDTVFRTRSDRTVTTARKETGQLELVVRPEHLAQVELIDPGGRAEKVSSRYMLRPARAGYWTVKASAEGHKPVKKTIVVKHRETAEIAITLRPVTSLEVFGGTDGDRLTVWSRSGRMTTNTELPWEGTLTSGAYRVEVRRDGAIAFETTALVDGEPQMEVEVPAGSEPDQRSIIIGGKRYYLGMEVAVKTFADPKGLSFYAKCKKRNRCFERSGDSEGTITAMRARLQRVFLDHARTAHPKVAFGAMAWNGQSAHFLIDANGTIHQTLDVQDKPIINPGEGSDSTRIAIVLTGARDSFAQHRSLKTLLDVVTRVFPQTHPDAGHGGSS